MKNTLLIITIVFHFQFTLAQSSSIQTKIISSEDFRYNGKDYVLDYYYTLFYQRQIKNKFHGTIGGGYNRVSVLDTNVNCRDCFKPQGKRLGQSIFSQIGLRYYLRQNKKINYFFEIGFDVLFHNSEGEYLDGGLFNRGYFKLERDNYAQKLYWAIGTDVNMTKRIFISILQQTGYEKIYFKSTYYWHHDNTIGIINNTQVSIPVHFGLRLGYRF